MGATFETSHRGRDGRVERDDSIVAPMARGGAALRKGAHGRRFGAKRCAPRVGATFETSHRGRDGRVERDDSIVAPMARGGAALRKGAHGRRFGAKRCAPRVGATFETSHRGRDGRVERDDSIVAPIRGGKRRPHGWRGSPLWAAKGAAHLHICTSAHLHISEASLYAQFHSKRRGSPGSRR